MVKNGIFRVLIRYVLIIAGTIATVICINFVCMSIMNHSSSNFVAKAHAIAISDECSKGVLWGNHLGKTRHTYLSEIWGTYSPGQYFGMKTAAQKYSLASGILWSVEIIRSRHGLRHNTNQDELDSFDWLFHDGRHYGVERLIDSKFELSIDAEFVLINVDSVSALNNAYGSMCSWIQKFTLTPTTKNGESRIDMVSIAKPIKSFFLYFGVECSDATHRPGCLMDSGMSNIEIMKNENRLLVCGHNNHSGWFCWYLTATPTATAPTDGITADVDGQSIVEQDLLRWSFSGLRDLDTSLGVRKLQQDADMLSIVRNRNTQNSNRVVNSVFNILGEGELNDEIEENASFVVAELMFSSSVEVKSALFEHLPSVNNAEEMRSFMKNVIDRHDSDGIDANISEAFTRLSTVYSSAYHEHFNEVFPLNEIQSNFSDLEVLVAQRALSSVLGGIGYFYGMPRIGDALDVDHDVVSSTPRKTAENMELKAAERYAVSLLTGTPSRTSFPRGFLWDEGFHQMIVSQWDTELSMQTLSDWLHAMHFASTDESIQCNPGGWIPREMILGTEALGRVPEEFVTQRVDVANPPTLLLVVQSLIDKLHATSDKKQCTLNDNNTCDASDHANIIPFLHDIYPLLHQWVQWYLHSQYGDISGSFRWRGRSLSDQKVIPNTLSSGLDDYPRSALPSRQEHHVDLHCWMITAVNVMSQLGSLLLQSPSQQNTSESAIATAEMALNTAKYAEQYLFLLRRLDELHWSEEHHGYFDVGMNSENSTFSVEIFFKCSNPSDQSSIEIAVPLEIARSGANTFCPSSHPQVLYPMGDGNGGYKHREVYTMDPLSTKLQHIPRIGYVSLFPLLLGHIDGRHTDKLHAVLNMIEDPRMLWTDYGLRSIAQSDKFYNKRNSPGDAPYWRGPIWMNINYLALSSLHHYSHNSVCDDAIKARTLNIYQRLRTNLIRTVTSQYHSTGYFWEQYDDTTGKGIRGHPFTGWTALIVNIMAEKY